MAWNGSYHFAIKDDIFWNTKGELAFTFIDKNYNLYSTVQNFNSSSQHKFDKIKYAFIENSDTIYADENLEYWQINYHNKKIYYRDSTFQLAENLRNGYSFFSQYW